MAKTNKDIGGKSAKPTQLEVNNSSEEKKQRGRKAGTERPKAYIYIDDNYRIDISDGMNKTVQKLITRERMNDSKPEDEVQYKKGDKYTDWEDNGHFSSYLAAFDKIHDLMILDGVKAREIVFVNEFMKINKEKYDYLVKKFESMFDEEQNLKDKNRIKGE